MGVATVMILLMFGLAASWWLWRRGPLAQLAQLAQSAGRGGAPDKQLPPVVRKVASSDERARCIPQSELGLGSAPLAESTSFLDMGELGVADRDVGAAPLAESTSFLDMGQLLEHPVEAPLGEPAANDRGEPLAEATAFLPGLELVQLLPAPVPEPEPAPAPSFEPAPSLVSAPRFEPAAVPEFAPRFESAPVPEPAPRFVPTLAPAPTPSPEPFVPPPSTLPPAAVDEEAPMIAVATEVVSSDEMRPYFDDACRRYQAWRQALVAAPLELEALAKGAEQAWLDAMALLASAGPSTRDGLLLPALRASASKAERAVAAASLLTRSDCDGLAAIVEQLGEHDEDEDEDTGLIDALLLWRAPEAERRLLAAAEAGFTERPLFWARLLQGRAIDPGPALLQRYLAAKDEAARIRGFNLLVRSAALEAEPKLAAGADAHFFHGDPGLRSAALEVGLALRKQQAWVLCRQLATDPKAPRACALAAVLGNAGEQGKLITWAGRSGAPSHGLWCASLTGRRAALELALDHLEGGEARDGFAYVSGHHGEAEALRLWWRQHGDDFAGDGRWLAGQPLNAAGVARALASLSLRHRGALLDELRLRGAAPAMRRFALARELRADNRQLADIDCDFEAGFPWSPG